LPVPVSPTINTVASVAATFSITSKTPSIAGLDAMIWSNEYRRSTSRRR
jgi:hypothetical protein